MLLLEGYSGRNLMLYMFVAADIDDVVVVTFHLPRRRSGFHWLKDMVSIDDGGCYFWRVVTAFDAVHVRGCRHR